MRIAVIDTGVHPDRETLEAALAGLGGTHAVQRLDARGGEDDEALWDAVLDAVLDADRVVTL